MEYFAHTRTALSEKTPTGWSGYAKNWTKTTDYKIKHTYPKLAGIGWTLKEK